MTVAELKVLNCQITIRADSFKRLFDLHIASIY